LLRQENTVSLGNRPLSKIMDVTNGGKHDKFLEKPLN
jgi:hypothetical protein